MKKLLTFTAFVVLFSLVSCWWTNLKDKSEGVESPKPTTTVEWWNVSAEWWNVKTIESSETNTNLNGSNSNF